MTGGRVEKTANLDQYRTLQLPSQGALEGHREWIAIGMKRMDTPVTSWQDCKRESNSYHFGGKFYRATFGPMNDFWKYFC